MLFVTNRNSFTLVDRFDGIEYKFVTNEKVRMEDAAALHIFGYGDDNKLPYLIRQGWCKTTNDADQEFGPVAAKRILNKFIFAEVDMVEKVISVEEPVADTPAKEEKGGFLSRIPVFGKDKSVA